MKPFIGVLDSKLLIIPQSMKRYALLFHRLAVPRFREFWLLLNKHKDEFRWVSVDELGWLHDREIIYEPTLEVSQEVFEREDFATSARAAFESLMEFRSLPNPIFDDPDQRRVTAAQLTLFILEHGAKVSRYVSIMIREQENADAVPLITLPDQGVAITAGESEVASIVLNNLPIPSEQTSWEHILEFRNDPEAQEKFFRLRRWMTEVSRDKASATEIEQKLEYLLHDYAEHMKLHRLKIERGVLETFLTTSGELIDNLIKIKWGKLAETMFTIRHRRLALLEAEMSAPGREIAYVYGTKEYFKN